MDSIRSVRRSAHSAVRSAYRVLRSATRTTSRAANALARLACRKQSDIPVREDFKIDRSRWYYDPSENPEPAADRLYDSISLDDAGFDCDSLMYSDAPRVKCRLGIPAEWLDLATAEQLAEEADYEQELLSEVPEMQMLICSLQYQIQAETTRCAELEQATGAWKKRCSQLQDRFIWERQLCKRLSADKRASVCSDTTVC
ncbi:hypothetical protein GGI07_000610 [Coemansia sp. Benny D115]|nr:hypothetical protein GGI07_000610 [Coemansia sp. Benny D115]